MNKIIDSHLPNSRPPFKRAAVTIQDETFNVYFRNVIQCIRALYSHAEFARYLIFTLEHHYGDADKTLHLYYEMNTGKWWWAIQVFFNASKLLRNANINILG